MYETGGMRRTHLRGRLNILKRLLIHAVGFNLSLLVRVKYGIGKPRTLQGAKKALLSARMAFLRILRGLLAGILPTFGQRRALAA